jgi:hypothetical protein
MKRLMRAIMLCAFPLFTYAQSNPVTAAVRDTLQGRQKMLVEAAQEMPPDKYGFKPTPAQMSFGHLLGQQQGETAECDGLHFDYSPSDVRHCFLALTVGMISGDRQTEQMCRAAHRNEYSLDVAR